MCDEIPETAKLLKQLQGRLNSGDWRSIDRILFQTLAKSGAGRMAGTTQAKSGRLHDQFNPLERRAPR